VVGGGMRPARLWASTYGVLSTGFAAAHAFLSAAVPLLVSLLVRRAQRSANRAGGVQRCPHRFAGGLLALWAKVLFSDNLRPSDRGAICRGQRMIAMSTAERAVTSKMRFQRCLEHHSGLIVPSICGCLWQVLLHEAVEVAQAAMVEAHYYCIFGAPHDLNSCPSCPPSASGSPSPHLARQH